MALFRPATMDSGATRQYINVKHKRAERVQRHPMLDEVTKETHGVLLFQEQVISVLRNLGMDPDNLTKFLKAVKASQQDEMVKAKADIEGYEVMVNQMAKEAGINDDDWTWLWEAITGFAAYGFNRAHSTVYGLTAYRCGYLAANHPIEFHAALLNVAAGGEKEAGYITATRKREIRIARADIQESGISYEVSANGRSIRKGLTSVKGCGVVASTAIIKARPAGGFESLDQFCRLLAPGGKVNGVKPYLETGDKGVGVLGKLMESGAMDSLEGA
jgi:DNA polymerase-3 subunit alpha